MAVTFQTTSYLAGLNPQAVAVSDVNGDRKLDLIVANYGGGFSVLLGNGTGAFGAATTYSIGPHPRSIAVADMNGDGKLDIVVTSFGNTVADPSANGSVAVFLGNGSGAFGTPTTYANAPYPGSVAAVDLNGDRKADIVYQSAYRGVTVLLNDGKGGFGVPYVVGSGSSLTTRDVNSDGKLDLVVVNAGSVGVQLGDGKGRFGAAATYAAGPDPQSVTTADVNQDGKLDLLVVNYTAGVSVMLGDGHGGFGSATTYAAGPFPQSVTTADMNGDGRLDLIVANSTSRSLSLLLGDGKGGFAAATTFDAGPNPSSVMTGDFNKDGRLDIVATDFQGGVSVLLNTTPPHVFWSVSFADSTGPHSAYYSAIERTLLAAGEAWSSFLGGSGAIDIVVEFANAGKDFSASSDPDWYPGHFSSTEIETSAVAYEIAHGSDPNGAAADLTMTINADYLSPDVPGGFWFDPGLPVPAGKRDALSTFEHEIGHALGITGFWDRITGDAPSDGARSQFDRYMTKTGSTFFFNGPNAVLLNQGRPVALDSTHAKSLVYHVTDPADLMFYHRVNGPAGRTGISALDLAILNDTGVAIANGTAAADVLSCVTGQISIDGGGGNDTLSGNELDNSLGGGDGNDTLKGLAGKDELNGGEGDDYLVGGASKDTLNGGNGNDLASYDDATKAVTASLAASSKNTGDASGDVYVSIENLAGSRFNDKLYGDANGNTLRGNGGADHLDGMGGFDYASYLSASTGIRASLANPAVNTGEAAGDTYTSIEGLYGSQFDDTLIGDSSSNTLVGLKGADRLDGGLGYDSVSYLDDASNGGKSGVTVDLATGQAVDGFGTVDTLVSIEQVFGTMFNDKFTGGPGDYQFVGYKGADSFVGGAGVDVVDYSNDASQGGTSGVTVNLATGTAIDGFGSRDKLSGIEIVIGTGVIDKLTGDGAANVLRGLAGADTLDGGAGGFDQADYSKDQAFGGNLGIDANLALGKVTDGFGAIDTVKNVEQVIGTAYADRLVGSSVANALLGGSGNDLLDGGKGNDTLTGGSGKDIFDFTTTLNGVTNVDSITDFSVVDDQLQLDQAIFIGLSAGALSAAAFFAGAVAHDVDDRIIYNATTGALLYDGDGTGAGKAVQFASLSPRLVLEARNFMVS